MKIECELFIGPKDPTADRGFAKRTYLTLALGLSKFFQAAADGRFVALSWTSQVTGYRVRVSHSAYNGKFTPSEHVPAGATYVTDEFCAKYQHGVDFGYAGTRDFPWRFVEYHTTGKLADLQTPTLDD